MKRLIAAVAISLFATAAYAACRTFTVMGPGGQLMICTECCTGNHCTITCV